MAQENRYHIQEMSPQLEAALATRLTQAAEACHRSGDRITFRNLIMQAIALGGDDASIWAVSFPFNEELVYQHLQNNPKDYGVILFSKQIERDLDIEPGLPITRMFREEVGRFFIEQLPQTYQRILACQQRPVFQRLDQCERGLVGMLFLDGRLIVAKYLLSPQEAEIALELGEASLAPEVYEVSQNAMAEEFIADPLVTEFLGYPENVAKAYGFILSELHKRMIVYANRMQDHILIGAWQSRKPEIRIIDLEGAHRGDEFDEDWKVAVRELECLYRSKPHDLKIALNKLRQYSP